MKVKIDGFISYQKPDPWDGKDAHGFTFTAYNPNTFDSRFFVVQPYSFEFDVPDNFDPRPDLVRKLEAKKQKLKAEFSKSVMDIDRQINELLAINHTDAS